MNNTFVRWNPLRELEEFQNRIRSAFNTTANHRENSNGSSSGPAWMPLVDIMEDEQEYRIAVEIADVNKEDVNVTLEGGMLTLSGERKFEAGREDLRYHRVERPYGGFSRSFALPDDADPESVTADFKNGVLRVRVRKSESAKPKQIQVKVS
ncbi:Hsp20/alpha crystallin family protein [Brevifollis gellanilyticus]|uniref:Molecular chaperone n=1 Tax=Brevifollis gellanilyticus TaxID=748831 RepID=A0A512M8Q9_9BACT|nr:Hsp20/alpha crystallin family protein [Brevifollis gellanilyticus]GEP43083.1 molecular chaperone [Brevifollis gellanilyticus]